MTDGQEFGIDIVSEDNRTIVHHKVAAKAFPCVNQNDVNLSYLYALCHRVYFLIGQTLSQFFPARWSERDTDKWTRDQRN